ncbi:hypothetical protein BD408DRAFT_162490 [Parasitella parasitica]|nr:hypothetical protein BD408DRAFT_162490 [Parasitella parasitica]
MNSPSHLSGIDLIESYINYEKSHKENRINLRLLLPGIHTGKIIGQKGKTIQSISNFYHVLLQFTKYESLRPFMRLFLIKGRAEDCAMACTNCFEMLVESYNDPTQNGVDFVLPDFLIQYLKEGGRSQNGENVFGVIALQTNTEIRIMSQNLPNSTERIVRISIGNKESIRNFYLAVKLLTRQLDENLTLAMCAPENKFYQQEKEDDLLFTDIVQSPDRNQEVYCEFP